ncbi:MAG: methyltransferase domain-containing protein [Burkholderiales bacterium]|nr:methyltransferase domain-containing protein [Burkholderiales bacterium]
MTAPYRHFPFPLNVYAHIVAHGGATPDYLHYGLFAPGCETIAQAQAHSTQLVLDHLLPPPARILEVGTGLGATFAKLQQRGYEVTGVNPDAHQIAYAKEHFGTGEGIVQSRWEEFDAGGRQWDAVLFQESSQYIAPHDIFSRAPAPMVLIVDEVRLKPQATGLNLLADVLQAAQANGFTLSRHIDLSQMAAPTVDHLLHMTALLRGELMAQLGVSAQQLDGLDRSNEDYRRKYADGSYGYVLLAFIRTQRS